MLPTERMTPGELRAAVGLAGIFGLRMLGMFIILPVFALYAQTLPGGENHTLVGIALGAYGLTQALLQVPFGWLSDRWGRKQTIYLGLGIFAAGSAVAALATDIHWVIAGRVIQGAGAISAAVMALASDLTRDEQRTKAMAIIGMTIGATFAVSMVVGPVLAHWIGIPGIFWLTGALACVAIPVVFRVVPDPAPRPPRPALADPAPGRSLLLDPDLLRLNFGIFSLHALLMALFVVVPIRLQALVAADSHWKVYLPVMLASFALMVPPMLLAERRQARKPVFLGAIAVLIGSVAWFSAGADSLAGIVAALLAFFAAFNLLEAMLPALVSRMAPAERRGAAIGIYSSVQFIGTFAGAAAGGWLLQNHGPAAPFAFGGLLAAAWLLLALGMRVPGTLDQKRYPLPDLAPEAARGLMRRISGLPGVREAMLTGEGVACLTVDRQGFDEQNVIKLIAGEKQAWPR